MKRIVEVSTPGSHLRLENRSLVVERGGIPGARVPLEDLGTLILASSAITTSSALLAALSESGAVTVVAGMDHQPEGVLLPLRAHSTRGERIRAQLAAKRPLEKQLWARLVRAKIQNQAAVLEDLEGAASLRALAARVRSGDPQNLEARAARTYWPLVFQSAHPSFRLEPFRRSRSGAWPNSQLNYGYAILRAMTGRALCGAGLVPEVGLHHHNRYDPFALASDVMEPFRPWVDEACQRLVAEGESPVDQESKRELLGIYDAQVEFEGATTPLSLALERTASSLASAFLDAARGCSASEAAGRLSLPTFRSQA